MPHLRPLWDLIDPRMSATGRRLARMRLSGFIRRALSLPPARPHQTLWHDRVGRDAVDVPAIWPSFSDADSGTPLAVVIHHGAGGSLLETFVELGDLDTPHDTYILTDLPLPPDSLPPISGRVEILQSPRDSRDWGLTALVNSGRLNSYDVVLRRDSREPGSRAHSDRHRISSKQALASFLNDPHLGIIVDIHETARVTPLRARPGVRRLLRRLELGRPRASWTYPTGGEYWVRGFLLQGLRALSLGRDDFESRVMGRSGVDRLTFAQALGALCAEAGCSVQDAAGTGRPDVVPADSPRARTIAFYLPQFHPIPENNKWWGPGFTEWTNVTAARPVYKGHFQPKLPQDLGFYDLRLPEVREAQADLAYRSGLAGFMYYHYWFAGRRLLEQPLNEVLASDLPSPFCIMWANENWTRAWDGGVTHVLMSQDHDAISACEFIDDVMPFLRDSRYLRVNGKALLSVYRPGQIPNFKDVVAEWRRRAALCNVPLFVLGVDVQGDFDRLSRSAAEEGIDGYMAFPPHRYHRERASLRPLRLRRRFVGSLYDYGAMVREDVVRLRSHVPRDWYPGVMVNFDNTARRPTTADIWVGSNPYTFRRWLNAAVEAVEHRPADERIVFVNAWNEWAEGAILEPTTRFGHTYLLAVRDVVGGAGAGRDKHGVGGQPGQECAPDPDARTSPGSIDSR